LIKIGLLRKGILNFVLRSDREPQIEPCMGEDRGNSPWMGMVPVSAEIAVGKKKQIIDVKLEAGKVMPLYPE